MKGLALVAYLLAAVLFLLDATGTAALGAHKLSWGLCAVAVGLVFDHLAPYVPGP